MTTIICGFRRQAVRQMSNILTPLEVFRRKKNSYGEPDGEFLRILRCAGYRFYKYERLSQIIKSGGRILHERTERIMVFPAEVLDCAECKTFCELPTILEEDRVKIEEQIFRVCAIQKNMGLTLTLVVEKEALSDAV